MIISPIQSNKKFTRSKKKERRIIKVPLRCFITVFTGNVNLLWYMLLVRSKGLQGGENGFFA
ncbi:hypothetical protein COY32_06940 [candidate division WWE3 bacterium CG_4_10_14_0_2_um_filter_41_14]|uniref:Uncharacterized protein n=1 Tax=candidate division WWE3 bacterium CG_4_10_14_0_2_um_filter_41_14 TaxID=1975072 RepID=A0A2M7TES8_UNCKA|nr:MAG: hypothetical protein COY32_06940 [candidate division WWE3 bacterium CG_4_10_14_0_2_um_filter_41_14]